MILTVVQKAALDVHDSVPKAPQFVIEDPTTPTAEPVSHVLFIQRDIADSLSDDQARRQCSDVIDASSYFTKPCFIPRSCGWLVSWPW